MDNRHIGVLVSRVHNKLASSRQLLRQMPDGITIAIPNWNHEYALPHAIQSALKTVEILSDQQIKSEVIVVDDYSRDGSLTLLRQLEALYYKEGLRILALPCNEGLASARNRALEEATYRHLIYLDADNELLPENIPVFFEAAQQTQAAVVFGRIRVQEQGRRDDKFSYINNGSFQSSMFTHNYIDACALYDRQQVFDLGGTDTHAALAFSHEDWELYLHLAANGRLILFVPEDFGYYYVTPGSMMRAGNAQELHERAQVHIKRVFDQFGIRERQLLKTRQRLYHTDDRATE